MDNKNKIIKDLWKILDDIDTADDAFKSNDSVFREFVIRQIKKRWETGITTDGYEIEIP